MINYKEFKEKLERTVEDSNCNITIDLLNWRSRFDCGYDKNNDCVELVWLYVNLGPVQLHLSLGHWGRDVIHGL